MHPILIHSTFPPFLSFSAHDEPEASSGFAQQRNRQIYKELSRIHISNVLQVHPTHRKRSYTWPGPITGLHSCFGDLWGKMRDKKGVLELRPNLFGKLIQYYMGSVLMMYIRYFEHSESDPILGHLPITAQRARFVT